MRELVIISGKGGTGKTSVLASFAALAREAVLADCDVDAADLHLILSPQVRERRPFRSGHVAIVRPDACTGCGECLEHCRFGAVRRADNGNGAGACEVDPVACEGCGVCVHVCPAGAVDFPEQVCGEWFVSGTRFGPMVHARLGIAAENSGKLVATVRKEARRIGGERGAWWLLVDGPPGIGCPVIASVTGADAVLVVTEPTLSGEHDLDRVLALAEHFRIPASVCVNKWDLNPDVTERIERMARSRGVRTAGRIRYDRSVTAAQILACPVVELGGPAAEDIAALWESLLSDWPLQREATTQQGE